MDPLEVQHNTATQNLRHYHSIIQKILDIAIETPELWPVLERKISQVEEIILDIPALYEESIEDWRNEITRLWTQYSAVIRENRKARGLVGCDYDDLTANSSLESATSTEQISSSSSESDSLSDNESTLEAAGPITSQEFCNSSLILPPTEYLKKINNQTKMGQPKLDIQGKMYDQLAEELDRLGASVEVADIESMNQLLLITAKYAMASRIFVDDDFHYELFKLVMGKLPPSLLPEYEDYAKKAQDVINPKKLAELKIFLGVKIREEHQVRNAKLPKKSPTKGQFCAYCKAVGHFIDDCSKVKQRTCFKCFQPGHKAKYCNSPK